LRSTGPASNILEAKPWGEAVATISWIGTTGGDWSDPSNWQGGVVPGTADEAVMNLSNAETVTISSLQMVRDVSFDDPAATFVIASSGALIASGDVTLDGASIIVNGPLSAAAVTLGTFNAVVLPETGLLVPGNLSGGTSPLDNFLAVTAPAPVTSQPFDLAGVSGIIPDGLAPVSRPIIAVAPANEPNNLPSLILNPPTVPATAGGNQFLGSSEPLTFLNGGLAPAWGGLDPAPRNFVSEAETVFGAGDGAVVTATGFRPEVLAAGAGNETLIAGAGSDTCFAGTGTVQMIGGSSAATFLFSDGNVGGAANIENFLPGQDFVALRNYGSNAVQDALASASVAAGSTTITLVDNSRITFIGVASLTQSDFR
jgi:hypothetical protein